MSITIIARVDDECDELIVVRDKRDKLRICRNRFEKMVGYKFKE
jgi:hypothetical protein